MALPCCPPHAPLIWLDYYPGLQWESRVTAGCGAKHPRPPTQTHTWVYFSPFLETTIPATCHPVTPSFFRPELQITPCFRVFNVRVCLINNGMSYFNWKSLFFLHSPRRSVAYHNQRSLRFAEIWSEELCRSRNITLCQRRGDFRWALGGASARRRHGPLCLASSFWRTTRNVSPQAGAP